MVVDFSVDVEGYTSDIARTFYFLKKGETKAPPDVQTAFDTAVRAVHTVIAEIKPGMAGYQTIPGTSCTTRQGMCGSPDQVPPIPEDED